MLPSSFSILTQAVGPFFITLFFLSSSSMVQGQLTRSDAFNNTYVGGVPGAGFGINPCVIGNQIQLRFTNTSYVTTCSTCTTSSSIFPATANGYAESGGDTQLWEISKPKGADIPTGSVALLNVQTKKYLGRCSTPACLSGVQSSQGVTPVVVSDSFPSANTAWSCVKVQSTQGATLSGFRWVLAGGKGKFLGQVNEAVYPTTSSPSLVPQFALLDYVSTVNRTSIQVPMGDIVFNDIYAPIDANE
ncbi:hypothetical protein BJ684DRAFT_16724 [Piptocephalis cylindrospora]|uniref:Uncharacterized protein n=1 Tax=Piptocephalis cylindrospora TaxID=1907219 RepID=A0A4V1IY00_9FUNG|nr:hypothetical protein BJ684DRAFT_16724 [Piptocephalis cylindrospora]|eukprot:RKP12829.1 hypothetical protein BJ684DRAFT_16724 [Piptocephalis cylindrospora]